VHAVGFPGKVERIESQTGNGFALICRPIGRPGGSVEKPHGSDSAGKPDRFHQDRNVSRGLAGTPAGAGIVGLRSASIPSYERRLSARNNVRAR